eukprot:2309818-Amphidinium_carterae.1
MTVVNELWLHAAAKKGARQTSKGALDTSGKLSSIVVWVPPFEAAPQQVVQDKAGIANGGRTPSNYDPAELPRTQKVN